MLRQISEEPSDLTAFSIAGAEEFLGLQVIFSPIFRAAKHSRAERREWEKGRIIGRDVG